MTTGFLGYEGFRWFIGVVEDRDDPLKLGRVRVRIYNVHSEKKSLVNTTELPWAGVLNIINSSSLDKVGISPTGIQVGSTVVGFFMDGNDGNNPIIMGTLAGIPDNKEEKHDVAKEARGINAVPKPKNGSGRVMEPDSAFAAKYPYNKVIRTERGHVIEVDDTPDKERIHIYHKSGTYSETNNVGRKVDKVVNDHYEIIVKDHKVWIGGNVKVHVMGNVDMMVEGTYRVESKGNMSFKAPRIDLN